MAAVLTGSGHQAPTTDRPLSDEQREWVYTHGSALLRSLLNEVAILNRTLKVVEYERDELRHECAELHRDRRSGVDV